VSIRTELCCVLFGGVDPDHYLDSVKQPAPDISNDILSHAHVARRTRPNNNYSSRN
jgi:hypothetical protein